MTEPPKAIFCLGHISDLHFSNGTHHTASHHKHDPKLLLGVQRALAEKSGLEHLIVTGDISNVGDPDSLHRARDWFTQGFHIGEGKRTGLGFDVDQLFPVPGNHDAYNAKTHGTMRDRRQASLENYNSAFPEFQMSQSENEGCYYRWLEKNGEGIFLAFLDSTYLGEQFDDQGRPLKELEKIARGSFAREQIATLLHWFDLGMDGRLPKSDSVKESIPASRFARSLKVLVTHHYLYEPPGVSDEFLMSVKHRDIAFSNIGLAHFDIMLCGHRHVDSVGWHAYTQNIHRRARARHVLNVLRRRLGIYSLPLQLKSTDGKPVSKKASLVFNAALSKVLRRKPKDDSFAIESAVAEALEALKEDPKAVRKQLDEIEGDFNRLGESVLFRGEQREIAKQVEKRFGPKDQHQLEEVADELRGWLNEASKHRLLQIVSGSSTKVLKDPTKPRSFNTYDIEAVEEGWNLAVTRYSWDSGAKEFVPGTPDEYKFSRPRLKNPDQPELDLEDGAEA